MAIVVDFRREKLIREWLGDNLPPPGVNNACAWCCEPMLENTGRVMDAASMEGPHIPGGFVMVHYRCLEAFMADRRAQACRKLGLPADTAE